MYHISDRRQTVVQGGSQLFVINGHVQCEAIDGNAGHDEEEHVCGDTVECQRWSQVVLWVLVRAAHHASHIGHGNVKVWSLRAIHDERFVWSGKLSTLRSGAFKEQIIDYHIWVVSRIVIQAMLILISAHQVMWIESVYINWVKQISWCVEQFLK